MPLKITDGSNIINLKDDFCLKLEYEINRFGRKDNWVSIGNHLYYFVCPNALHPKSSDTLNVNKEKFNVIKDIIQKNNFN